MAGKGRPEKLTADIKKLITQLQHGRSKKLKAPEIQKELRGRLDSEIREYVKNKSLDWSEKMIAGEVESRLPGVSRIEKFHQELFPRLDSQSVADETWQMGTLALKDRSLPSETIPAILALKQWGEENPTDKFGASRGSFTIGQAQWVARLYGIANLLRSGKKKGMNKNLNVLEWLWDWSKAYAHYEKICEKSDTLPDTSKLDKGVWNGATILTADNGITIEYPDHLESLPDIPVIEDSLRGAIKESLKKAGYKVSFEKDGEA